MSLLEEVMSLRKEQLHIMRKQLELENAVLRTRIRQNVDEKNRYKYELEEIEDKMQPRLLQGSEKHERY